MPPKKPSQESPLEKVEAALKTASQLTKDVLKKSLKEITTPFTETPFTKIEEAKTKADNLKNKPYSEILEDARKAADRENFISSLERHTEEGMGIVQTAAKPATYSDYITKPTSNTPQTKKKEKVEKGL